MKLLPDFKTGTPFRPLADRLENALLALCGLTIPADTPDGLKAVAKWECRQSAELARKRFEDSDANQKRARIDARAEENRELHSAAVWRREQAEADLQESLAGTNEARIVSARSELEKATTAVAALAKEGNMLGTLLRKAGVECEAERRRIDRQTEQELLSAMGGRLTAARESLLAALQQPGVSEALGEFALCKHVLSLPATFGRGVPLAEAAAFEPMPDDRRGVPKTETVNMSDFGAPNFEGV
jgi:hypothetical protein